MAWAGGFLYTYWAIDNGQDAATDPNGVWYRYSSKHAGIVNMAFMDGSVQAIQKNISYTPFVYLGGMADGFVVTRP